MTEQKILTLKDSVQRLQWRFKSGKPFQINSNDADALNIITKTLNQNTTEAVQENRLFAKLYIIILQEMAVNYKSVMRAQKQLNGLLMIPVEELCRDMANKLNQMEGQKQLETDPMCGAQFLEASETWDLDSVVANINVTVSQAINNYKNLP